MGSLSASMTERVTVVIGVTAGLCLLGLEYWVAAARGQPVHRFRDSVANVACGVLHQIAGLHYSSFAFPAYELLRRRCGVLSIQPSIAGGVGLFLLIDFLYYWEHRLLHRHRVLWAAHVVHHQSDEFNLTVALRVSVLQIWMTTGSTLVLAIAGVPPGMALTALLVYKFYQLWTHTRLIRSLGPLEWVLVTPSHHRVHHAWNERYLDKNFGGVLIIWDRLFGTFEQEREPPRYGVAGGAVSTLNPVLANLQPWFAPGSRDATEAARAHPALSRSQIASALLRLVAVLGLTLAALVGDAGVGVWLLIAPVSALWLWQLGAVLEGRDTTCRGEAGALVLALGASAGVALLGASAGIAGTLLGGALVVALSASRAAMSRRAVDPRRAMR